MTVAAVVLAPSAEEALRDAGGRVAARRIVEVAWAGGALPIVVVVPDPDGRVAAALAGTPVVMAEPAEEVSDDAPLARGAAAAAEAVAETAALLAWPVRMTWVDAETVTSLIEAHGASPAVTIVPTWRGEAGSPRLVPLSEVLSPAGEETPPRLLELGDPGVILGVEVGLDDLPPYEGPPEPVAGPPPDWGAAAADRSDELPPEAPQRATDPR